MHRIYNNERLLGVSDRNQYIINWGKKLFLIIKQL